MEYGAIDLHLKTSLIRIVDADGVVLEDRTIATTRKMLTQAVRRTAPGSSVGGERDGERVVAQTVEACGHEVIVADPNYTLMYGQRQRRIKTTNGMWRRWPTPVGWAFTGRRIACRGATGHSAHGPDPRAAGAGADPDDQSAAGAAAAGGEAVTGGGRGVRGCAAERAGSPARVGRGAGAAADLLSAVAPLIAAGDARVARHAAADPVVGRLMTVPGIGPITAVTSGPRSTRSSAFPTREHRRRFWG